MDIQLDASWQRVLCDEIAEPYFREIVDTLKEEKQSGKIIYPSENQIFNAFNLTTYDKVKVVIIGQDPYHNPGQAMGLSFSVPKGVKVPPSLKNIYKELNADIGVSIPDHGDLTIWAEQGVFLLNAMLTVRAKEPGSHRKMGWQRFTDVIISLLSKEKKGLVFMLWGNFAITKKGLIDNSKHLILEAAHPSPLARGAYFGSKHFSQCNDYLLLENSSTIDRNV